MAEIKWKAICSCALSNGVPRQSFYVALVVGTVLNFINQGDAIFGDAPINWLKFILTYFVPYAVCTYGAVSAQVGELKNTEHQHTGEASPGC
jgi:hypothetical protein